jgi:hypothetical protein
MKAARGIVFVHGINQSEADLEGMQARIEAHLQRFGALEQFRNEDQTLNVWCAKWRSLGDFVADLIDLFRYPVRRDQAFSDIQTTIRSAWSSLQGRAERSSLLVMAHSMGQPLAVAALHGLQGAVPGASPSFPVPTSLLSMGGPLGNDDPVVQEYLSRGLNGKPWVRLFCPRKPEALTDWKDMFNPLDPVCHSPLLGSSTYPGSEHIVFRVPDQPDLPRPLTNGISEYHSAYFEYQNTYSLVNQMLDGLGRS